jgi:hypothetical protein
MDWLQFFRDISILVGTWIAIYGIDSWRREHTGKRRLELAEDTLALFYEARDAISHMRSPFSFASESEVIEKGEHESTKSWEARKNASVILKRYNQHQELFNKIHAMRYRFMAQIGKNEAEPFEALRKIINEMTSSAHMLARLWARDHFRDDKDFEKHFESVKKYEAIFWEGLKEEDPITSRLNALIEEIERTCNRIISGKGTLSGPLNIRIKKKS